MTTNDIDSVDWSKYPPDRVEGLKYFRKGPSADEDGPCTEEELKMLCTKWECRVDMRVDNFLFWLMKKTKEKNFNGDEERFRLKIPQYFNALRTSGLRKYELYQKEYADANRHYLQRCAEWRKMELRRLRYLDKLRAMCSTWSCSDSEDEDDSDSDSESESETESNIGTVGDISITSSLLFGSNSSINTVIDTLNRYNAYPETESQDIQGLDINNVGSEEVVENLQNVVDELDVNTQCFIPQITSTQN